MAGASHLPAARALRLAHRGDWRVAPENTLAAMAAALAIPACDGLEFDVRGSADGVPVLLHDATLARVQGIDAAVGDLTAAELARYGIPSLAEVLTATVPASGPGGKDWPFLDVELKGEPVPAVIEVLEEERGSLLERTVVSSFEVETLRWLGERRPAWPRWLNAMSLSPTNLAVARDLACSGISVEWTSVDSAGIERARAEGLEVAAWTVTDLEAYSRLEALGVVAICAEGRALEG